MNKENDIAWEFGYLLRNLYFGGHVFQIQAHIFFHLVFYSKTTVICNAYIFHLPPKRVKQTKNETNTELFSKNSTYILGCMVQNRVFFHLNFFGRRSFFLKSKIMEGKYMSLSTSKWDKDMNWNFLSRNCGPLKFDLYFGVRTPVRSGAHMTFHNGISNVKVT